MEIERKLQATLFRVDCPTAAELGDYHLHLLDGERGAVIAGHLQICPHCAAEVAQLTSFLAEVGHDLEISTGERLRKWIGRLLTPPSTSTGLRPAMALRGDDHPPLTFVAGPAQIVLEFEIDASGVDCRTVIGLIVGVDATSLQAALWPEEGDSVAPVSEAPVDNLGGFTLMGIVPGRYELLLIGDDVEYRLQGLDVV